MKHWSTFCGLVIALSVFGCGGSTSSTEAPSMNEYEAYLAENPEAAEVMSEEEDSADQ